MAGNQHPERLVNFRVYNEQNDLLGIATVDLPEIEFMSDTVSGAGIAGEIESPVLGHVSAMSATFSWRTIEEAAIVLADSTRSHHLEVRGSQQVYDSASGVYSTKAIKAVLMAKPKTISLGTFEPGATTDTEQEFAVDYFKLYVAGKVCIEIDQLGNKHEINGVNALEAVNRDLGLA